MRTVRPTRSAKPAKPTKPAKPVKLRACSSSEKCAKLEQLAERLAERKAECVSKSDLYHVKKVSYDLQPVLLTVYHYARYGL